MKKPIALLTALAPSLAYAHPGHGGLGLFHHAWDVMLMVVVAAALYAGWHLYKRR
ncbi:hypothetical protein [Ferrimonas balearica]|uniref:hypothetical protein n=1 Tax=Ferrimonas balearica TaxID=44012 RepID=UPI001C57FC50|nr:hypothetical protein [Ferrimonas balearica]MBY6017840.1 hypothetical protein [Halomonas denitrificans]MBW3139669.1 hypothetical protein [Ferrimonas balearica]MBY6094196.1 hypothetical protein [Ferrimonas balearica]MBY6107225.1 hypothetical protein [Ferrimonas balearica]MBY6224221.1 hypothetical protein [Ferrimonas balearica]